MNRQTFESTLQGHYRDLFASDPGYAYIAARTTPEALAAKMTFGLATNTVDKAGDGIKRTCRDLKIPHTYKAIRNYLTA